MSKRRSILLVLPVAGLLAAAAAAWLARPKKSEVTIEVSGRRGLAVVGTCEVDGDLQDLKGAVPARFVLEGSRVTYTLTSSAKSGEFRVRAAIDGRVYGSSGSGNPPRNGVRGWVKSDWGWSGPRHWIESFDRDEEPEWLDPPP
jgi:hypothetical protein